MFQGLDIFYVLSIIAVVIFVCSIIYFAVLWIKYSIKNKNNKPNFVLSEKSKYYENLHKSVLKAIKELELKGLDTLLLTDYHPNIKIKYNFSETKSRNKLQADLEKILVDMCTRLRVPTYVNLKLVFEYTNNTNLNDKAGYFKSNNFFKEIEVRIKEYYSYDAILAILSHEATHYFMEYQKLNEKYPFSNEIKTDIIANLIGFNEIMIRGYQETLSYIDLHRNIKYKVGYISGFECKCIKEDLLKYRKEYEELDNEINNIDNAKNELKELIKVAEDMYYQLDIIDPRKSINKDIEQKEQIEKISSALYEYENIDIIKIINIQKETIKENDLNRIKLSIEQLNNLCIKMLEWSKVFQGII